MLDTLTKNCFGQPKKQRTSKKKKKKKEILYPVWLAYPHVLSGLGVTTNLEEKEIILYERVQKNIRLFSKGGRGVDHKVNI